MSEELFRKYKMSEETQNDELETQPVEVDETLTEGDGETVQDTEPTSAEE